MNIKLTYLSVAVKPESVKIDESGNDPLTLANILKKYQISPAQLIQLIKNSQLNPSGNIINSSLNTVTSAVQLIESKDTGTLHFSTYPSSMLNNSPSAKICSF